LCARYVRNDDENGEGNAQLEHGMTSSISQFIVSEASTLWSFERSGRLLIGGTAIGAYR
jgi:hypothetical protein